MIGTKMWLAELYFSVETSEDERLVVYVLCHRGLYRSKVKTV